MSVSETVCWQCKEVIKENAEKCPHCSVRRLTKGDVIAANGIGAVFALVFAGFIAVVNPALGAVLALFITGFVVYLTRRKLRLGHYRHAP